MQASKCWVSELNSQKSRKRQQILNTCNTWRAGVKQQNTFGLWVHTPRGCDSSGRKKSVRTDVYVANVQAKEIHVGWALGRGEKDKWSFITTSQGEVYMGERTGSHLRELQPKHQAYPKFHQKGKCFQWEVEVGRGDEDNTIWKCCQGLGDLAVPWSSAAWPV